MKKQSGKVKGITLIALVITIIILLILAGVSIATLTGEGGILGKASTAKEETKIAEYKERLELIGLELLPEKHLEQIDSKEYIHRYYARIQEVIEKEDLFRGTTIMEKTEETIKVRTKEGYNYLITESEVKYLENENTDDADHQIPDLAKITFHNASTDTDIPVEVTVEQSDNDEVDITKCKWVYTTKVDKLGLEEENYTGGFFKENPERLTIKIETVGTYYLHILTVDRSGNKRETVEETTSIIVEKAKAKPGVIVEKENREYEKNGKTTIPVGFMIVPGLDDVSQGLVISDNVEDTEVNANNKIAKGNQFVWVVVDPSKFERIDGYNVDNVLQTVKDSCIEPYVTTGYNTEKEEYDLMKESVKTNGGFFIGRYETGQDELGNAVVQKGVAVYNNIPWGKSMTDPEGVEGAVYLARNFIKKNYTDKGKMTNIKSTLCYGVQWDSTYLFMDNEYDNGIYNANSLVKNPTNKGWFTYNYNVVNENTTTNPIHRAGIDLIYSNNRNNIANQCKNIYDMLGNVREWTMEARNETNRLARGGSYLNNLGATGRGSGSSADYTGEDTGFRIALYL